MNQNPPTFARDEIRHRTYICDLWRGGLDGVLSTGAQTFSLFLAIRLFDANHVIKALIASAPFLGMIFSLLLVHYVSNSGLRKSICGALPAAVTGACLIIAAWTETAGLFALFVIVSYVCRSALLPFITSIYGDNYPPARRAEYFARPLLLTVGISSGFGLLGASVLEWDLDHFSWLYTFLGICGLGKAFAILMMPSRPIEETFHTHPFGNLKYVFEDKSFGYVLLTWFIMGFANLWTLPLRVDYVTSSSYGIEASPLLVAILITVIPESMRMVFIPMWARLFDRMNFVLLRMALNILFAIGVAVFFVTDKPVIIAIGSAFIGLSFAGGSIAWNLWVIKYAPSGKTAAYMSVHVFLTGIRGVLGPLIGYWAASRISIQAIGWTSFGLMVLATVMLIPEIKHGKRSEGP